jgi:hypothetical protein
MYAASAANGGITPDFCRGIARSKVHRTACYCRGMLIILGKI